MGKPPKLLEPLDCPNASKFAKSAFAEFWAVNGNEQYMLMNMKLQMENMINEFKNFMAVSMSHNFI